MADESPNIEALQARIVELEIRSEERRMDLNKLQLFVEGYEQRITRLEKQVADLRSMADSPAEPLPPASEDLPPHY